MWVLRADVKGQESWQSQPKEGVALSDKFARAEGECRHIPILFVKFSTVGQDWTMIRQILIPGSKQGQLFLLFGAPTHR